MIPFNRPSLAGNEHVYLEQALVKRHISGGGTFTKSCEELLEIDLGAPRVLLTTNCTHALEMAALLLDLKPGDEVIVPSFTFVSTINAFSLRGAIPVFVDIRRDTLNIDESLIESAITPKTRAIVVVHYAGVACEMDAILPIAKKHNIVVIEDNAHGLFGKYRGKQLGTFGLLATQSFHETKNITCGEGGALVINDLSFVERSEIIREKGTNRARFFRGQVDKYTWVDVGSSYVPSELLAAFLLAQLEKRDEIQRTRARIWERYNTSLADWATENGVRTPFVPEYCEQPFHMFYVILPTGEERDRFLNAMKDSGINAVFHYVPLDDAPAAARAGGRGYCPVTHDMSARLVRLPFFNSMTHDEQTSVISAVQKFKCGAPA